MKNSKDNQLTGNVGMYFVCYKLSAMNWNSMPTSRNAKGIDILIYNKNASRKLSIQVKSLSSKNPVPLGNKLDHLFADFIIICINVFSEKPECFIMTPSEIKKYVHRGIKNGKVSYWLQPPKYDKDIFREAWHRIN
jgi:hypothetical protein